MGGGGANSLDSPKKAENSDFESGENAEITIVEENWIDKAAISFAGGDGKVNDPYQISCGEELALLCKNIDEIKNYTVDKYFVLTNNIVLNDGYFDQDGNYFDGGDGILNIWKPIGTNAGDFRLKNTTLDGKNFSISGAFSVSEKYSGFISHCIDANIRNLKVLNSYFDSENSGAGGICASMGANSTISNCVFDGFVKALGWCGGIVGISQVGCKVYDCINYGSAFATRLCGGIVGFQNVKFEISNCKNYGDIGGVDYSFGGIVGQGNAIYCQNYGTISATNSVGGIIGTGDILKYCQNYGNVNGNVASGGLVGSGVIIYKCENYGDVNSSSNRVGGISGTMYSEIGIFAECINYGDVSCSNYGGGIVGLQYGKISKCQNYGNVYGGNYIGGISGTLETTAVVKDSINEGNVDARVRHNGIFGEGKNGALVSNTLSISPQDKCYVGNEFSGFYVDYKTGKIGIRLLSGKGFFQAEITEQTLIDKGFQKLTI